MAQHFTDSDFQKEVLEAKGLVMVDFWAEWCGPCRMMGPVIEALAEEMKGKVKIGKMDVDNNQATPSTYGIVSIPTTIFFKNGEEIDRLVGYQSRDTLVKKIQAHQ